MAQLIIKEAGTLLPVILDREITKDQLETIRIVLEDDQVAEMVREDARIEALMQAEFVPHGRA